MHCCSRPLRSVTAAQEDSYPFRRDASQEAEDDISNLPRSTQQ